MTISERLDPVSYGLTAEELSRYRTESMALDRTIGQVTKAGATYIKHSDLLNLMLKWMAKCHYHIDSKATLRARLVALGVSLDPMTVIDGIENTALGNYMLKIHTALVTQEYSEFAALSPDGDDDISRNYICTLLQTGRTDMDIYYILNSLQSTECSAEKNPSPPMRKKHQA